MRKLKSLIILSLLAFSIVAFAITKIDEATTNNPSKTFIDFLKGIDFKNNDGIYLPSGTTAQRPTPTKNGLIRFNSDLSKLEVYSDGVWGSVGGGLEKWATAKPYLVDDVVFQGDNIYKCLVAHTSTSFPTDLANGYWQELSQTDLSNYVDKTTNQTIAGEKTFSDKLTVNDITEFNGNSNVNGNIEVSGTAKIGSLTGVLKGSSGNVTTGQVDLASEVTGQLPIANGNNFVNTSNNQVIGGNKTFSGEVRVNNYTKIDNYLDVTDDLLVQGDTNTVGETATGTLKVGTLTGVMKSASGVVTADKVDLGTEVKSVLPYNNNGSSNLLKNATFGNTITDEFWTCTSVNPVGQSTTGQADINALSAHITLGTTVAGCLQNVTLPSGLVGKNLQWSMFLNSSQPSEMCVVEDGGNVKCQDYLVADGTKKMILTYAPKSTNVAILFRSKNNLSGNMYASKAYLGELESDEAIVAKFDNTTGIESCGLTASDFQGFGTPSNIQLDCARDGEFLHIIGSFLIGTSTSSEARINLKYRGQALQARSSAARMLVGTFTFSTGSAVNEKGGSIYAKNNTSYITFDAKSVFSGASIVIGTDYSGISVSYNNTPMIINAKIPIAEWASQTNAAIVACQKGPLKCMNTYTAKITGSTNAVSNYNTPTPWMSCANGANLGIKSCTYIGLNLNNRMNCIIETDTATGATNNPVTQVTNSKNTGLVTNTVPNNVHTDFTLTCTKTGADYNEAYERIMNLENFYVDANEIAVGYDRIDNKTIYQRCHKVVSDVTVAGTLATWAMNLNPRGNVINNYTNNWIIVNTSEGSAFTTVYYERNTGNLKANMVGGTKLGANSTICMEYTR